MKYVILLATAAFLGMTFAAATAVPTFAAHPGAMSGKADWGTRGYAAPKKAPATQVKKPKAVKRQP